MQEQPPHAHPVREEPPTRSGDENAENNRLAQFELLADPATICGNESPETNADSAGEIERLRSALHSRARELEAMRSSLDVAATTTTAAAPAEGSDSRAFEPTRSDASPLVPAPIDDPATPPRLDFDAALALAREARQRVDSTRQEVANARPEGALPALPEAQPEAHHRGGWSRHEMVSIEPPPAPREAPPAAKSDAPHVDEEVRGLHEELAELRATMAIARETTIGQRNELTQLRLERTRLEAEVARVRDEGRRERDDLGLLLKDREETRTALLRARDEAERLRDRLAITERDHAALESDVERLRETLHERQRDLDERIARTADLEQRLAAAEAEREAVERERSQERARSEAGERLLAELRSLLEAESSSSTASASVDSRPTPPPIATSAAEIRTEAPSEGPIVPAIEPARSGEPDATPPCEASDPTESEPRPADIIRTAEAMTEARPASDVLHPRAARPAIFDAWLDDQLRRHFGPMGIDRLADLVQSPLSKRGRADQTDPRIAILGAGSFATALRLAESLQATTGAFFRIHVFDPEAGPDLQSAGLSGDHPLREFVALETPPDSPAALTHALDLLEPSLVITRQFVSDLAEPEAWLGAFERVLEDDATLIFLERTDHGGSACSTEMTQIGERIWELMPDRYKRDADSGRVAESWQAAFESSEPRHASGCLGALRERFDFDLSAQFGYLAAPFVASTVGANFSPEAPRDRRFLQQVADLDDRKIEAGVAPALYCVAVASPPDDDAQPQG